MREARNGWLLAAVLVLGGCASDAGMQSDSVASRRPECLVGGEPISTARDSGVPSSRQRACEPDRSLNWSSEKKDTMKVDFGKKNE